MTFRSESFITAFADADAIETTASGLSTTWELIVGLSAGVGLIILALVVGVMAQRRGNALDEARKAELRSAAEASGAVSFTDLDLSDDSDFDLGLPDQPPASPPAVAAAEVPEYL